jgi:hypothetical protein
MVEIPRCGSDSDLAFEDQSCEDFLTSLIDKKE